MEGKNWGGIFGQVEDGTITVEAFLKEVSLLCRKEITFEQIAYAWWGFFSHLSQGVLRQLEEWRRQGYRIYMLTNNNPFMMSYIRSEGFAPEGKPFYAYFDKIFVSCEIGLSKPSREIYQYVLDDEELDPAETVFVDDRRQNLTGAKVVGMHTFLVEESEDWIEPFKAFLSAFG